MWVQSTHTNVIFYSHIEELSFIVLFPNTSEGKMVSIKVSAPQTGKLHEGAIMA